VDAETDALIQETIRLNFAHATVLTIAHRLETIVDADRIMLLSDGKLAEFDSPHKLLSEASLFRSLVSEGGSANLSRLQLLAQEAEAKRNRRITANGLTLSTLSTLYMKDHSTLNQATTERPLTSFPSDTHRPDSQPKMY
jgi:ABC-type multidrug transport system ATPase subunit